MAVRNEMGTLLVMASMESREMCDDLAKNNKSLADMLSLAYWDGVRVTSSVALDVANGTTTARVALLGIQDYGEGIRKLVEEGDNDGDRD